MFLVVIVVGTPGQTLCTGALDGALRASTAGSDRVEHSYLDTRPDRAAFSLYITATDHWSATMLAHQLIRRTMATLPGGPQWCVLSSSTL
ncbi:hypothetical protein [Longispora albida]|uniref:hypothetical protein n=1 Tax=Longispora albida TaxID=203523 RepID=UPI000379D9FD|nr:hypothetical protein [Longispora albida]